MRIRLDGLVDSAINDVRYIPDAGMAVATIKTLRDVIFALLKGDTNLDEVKELFAISDDELRDCEYFNELITITKEEKNDR